MSADIRTLFEAEYGDDLSLAWLEGRGYQNGHTQLAYQIFRDGFNAGRAEPMRVLRELAECAQMEKQSREFGYLEQERSLTTAELTEWGKLDRHRYRKQADAWAALFALIAAEQERKT